jgi:hypothetical protein
MSAFKKIWADQWSARMEYILTNALLALLEYPDTTLLDVNQMFINKYFRKKVVDYVTDPIVKSFWAEEFAGFSDRYAQEATPAIQNKIGQFTSNPLIRNIIGQAKSSFDMRDIMDNKKIFIANLSKGRMGETNADLLGSMLTTKIYLSAMSRADEPATVQAKLPPFYFYVDEFQSIANDSFADILSEARKYKLALVIAHQFVAQMEDNVRDAVFGNAGTIISFRVGPFDAEVLETVFKPKFFAEDIVNLGKYQIYLTLMIDGAGSPPFSATTLPPIEEPKISYKEQILQMSRDTYGTPREQIEEALKKRNENLAPKPQVSKKPASKPPQRDSQPHSASQSSNQSSNQKPPQKPEETQNKTRTESSQPKPTPRPSPGPAPRKPKQTVSLNALKFQQRPDSKGPSPEQLSVLRDALKSVQKPVQKPKETQNKAPQNQPPQKETSNKTPQPQPKVEPAADLRAGIPPRAETPKETQKEELRETKRETSNQTPREVPKEVLESILKDDTKE